MIQRNNNHSGSDDVSPVGSRLAVGWIITDERGDFSCIVGRSWDTKDSLVVDEVFLNPPEGHDVVWLTLRDGIGKDIYPYEYYPRFRVVANTSNQTYQVWGDEKILTNAEWQGRILREYRLPEGETTFLTDGLHYFSANPDSELVWDPVDGELKLIVKSYDEMLAKMDGFS
jgi:hypothetical protein